ncbi:MAG: hypothetical protein NTW59_03815 [Candidatus Diapherotrites archaeon]|nr:hypothetical protein [Candidatus Diapherotrites archaeon]
MPRQRKTSIRSSRGFTTYKARRWLEEEKPFREAVPVVREKKPRAPAIIEQENFVEILLPGVSTTTRVPKPTHGAEIVIMGEKSFGIFKSQELRPARVRKKPPVGYKWVMLPDGRKGLRKIPTISSASK